MTYIASTTPRSSMVHQPVSGGEEISKEAPLESVQSAAQTHGQSMPQAPIRKSQFKDLSNRLKKFEEWQPSSDNAIWDLFKLESELKDLQLRHGDRYNLSDFHDVFLSKLSSSAKVLVRERLATKPSLSIRNA